mgnify:CR=1
MNLCRAQLALYLIIALLGIGNILTACGQKGSLYLPEEPAAKEKETAISN